VAAVAIATGLLGYQLGVSHGLALNGQLAQGAQVPYGYYRPWGFGFGFPFLFFALWFFLLRGLFWGRGWHRGGGYTGPNRMQARFEEWHRRAHEQMESDPPAPIQT
jgi:hypothetical protein